MKTSTPKTRRLLVLATKAVADYTDDPEDYPFTDEEFAEMDGYDNGKIGSDQRNGLARLLREIRRRPEFYSTFREQVRALRQRMYKSPKRYAGAMREVKRLHPQIRTRKDRPAKAHRDCSYCGWGVGFGICGQCKQAGIDGPVIRGTEARKGGTYVVWTEKAKFTRQLKRWGWGKLAK